MKKLRVTCGCGMRMVIFYDWICHFHKGQICRAIKYLLFTRFDFE